MDTDKSRHNSQELNKKELQRIHKKLREKQRRNIILNVLTIILALAGITWAVNFFWRYYKYEITNDASIEQYISPINSRISGYIKKIYFTDHQYVKEGDTLLLIDDREFRIKKMDAEAALKDAEASASVLSSTIQTSSMNIDVSQANIDETKARLWKAEQDYKRFQNLLEADAVSQQQFDQIKSEYNAILAHYNALRKQQQSLQSTNNETLKKTENAAAIIERRKADLELSKLNLSYTVITAPFSGYVGRRTLEEGQLVQSGQTVTNLIKRGGKWVIANYREKQIENIYIGQKVRIKVDAIKNKEFSGEVTAISEATGSKYSLIPTDNAAGNFVKIQQRIPVRIDFINVSDEDMSKLRAGMMVITEAIQR